jgi:hypothetical protein
MGTLQIICPNCSYCEFADISQEAGKAVTTVLTAEQLEFNTQWYKYRCGPHGLCGHGYAAEDLNAFYDKIHGHDVQFSGRDNSRFGADRIVDGVQIQTKYCRTAQKTIMAAFPNESDGLYAYWDENGNPQKLEVPKDQHEECVELMRQKIIEGKVKNREGKVITDPSEADKIIKSGEFTQKQAENVTKAGNIDSLKFDIETGAVCAVSSFGISFAITLAMTIINRDKNGLTAGDAIKLAFLQGLKNGTISMSSHVMTSQVLKSTFGRNLAAYFTLPSKQMVNTIWETEVGKKIITNLANLILHRTDLKGGAAKQVCVRFFRTNAVSQLTFFVIQSIPNTIEMLRGRISKAQFISDLVVGGSTLTGATVGAVLASKWGGWASLGGGIVGGEASRWASKKITEIFHKDDSIKMQKIVKIALIELSNDYLLQSQTEFDDCIRAIKADGAIDTNLLRCMYVAGKDNDDDLLRARIAYRALEYYFDVVIRNRKTLHIKDHQELLIQQIDDLGNMLKEQPDFGKNDISS